MGDSLHTSILIPSLHCDIKLLDNVARILRDPSVHAAQIYIVIDGGNISDEVKTRLESVGVHLLVLEQNVGVGSALNFGLKSISSDFVRRMDADDEWVLGSIDTSLMELLQDNFVVFGTCLTKKNGRYLKPLIPSLPQGELSAYAFLTGNPIVHPTVSFKVDNIIKLGGYSEKRGAEDFDLWLRLYRQGTRFFNTDSKTVIYSREFNSASKSLKYKDVVDEIYDSWFHVVGKDLDLDREFLGMAICRGRNCEHSIEDIRVYETKLIILYRKLRELRLNRRLCVNIALRGMASVAGHESKFQIFIYLLQFFRTAPVFPLQFLFFTFQDYFCLLKNQKLK